MTATQYITIENTVFVVSDNDVHECGTLLHYDPVKGKGYQLVDDNRRVGLCSYATFGEDMYSAREAAAHWMGKARVAWAARDKGETFEREVEDDFDFEAEDEKMFVEADKYAESDPTRYYAYRAIANTYINEVADPWALADDICKRAEGLTEHEAFLVVQERVSYFDNFYC
jgi:hypothetical protein